jgi:hypothetical protein
MQTGPSKNEGDASGDLDIGFRGRCVQLALRLKHFDARFEFEVFCLKLRILHLKFRQFLLERSQRNLSRRLDVLESHRNYPLIPNAPNERRPRSVATREPQASLRPSDRFDC